MSADPKIVAARGGGGGGTIKATKLDVGEKVQQSIGLIGDVFNAFTTVNRFRIASVIVFFIGVYTDSIVISHGTSVFPATDVGAAIGQFFSHAFLGAMIIEFLFTTLTSPLITGKARHPISIFVLLINMSVNSIVTIPIARGLVSSGAWDNVRDAVRVFSSTVATLWGGIGGIDIGSGDVVIYTLGLTMAFSLAIGAEVLWHMGARRG